MAFERLFPIVASFLIALALTACKDNPADPQDSGLIGTWLVESLDGEPAGEVGATFVIGTSTISYAQANDGCHVVMSYVRSGNRLITTVIQPGCEAEAGDRDTVAYTLNGDKLTIDGEGVAVLRKMSGKDRVIGSWEITKLDGEALPQGVRMRVLLNTEVFGVTTQAPLGSCNTAFMYENDGTKLSIWTVYDECGDLPQGTEDDVLWTVQGNSIVLVFGDGTKLEGTRI